MRLSIVLVAAGCATLLSASQATAAGFGFGVAAGEVSSSSALLWTRADGPGRVTMQLLRGARVVQRHNAVAEAARDNTVRVRVRRLRPDTRYRYRFQSPAGRSATGTFVTAPRPRARRTVRFAISGDADATVAPGAQRPFFNEFEVYERMRLERNHFNVNFGDTIYSDSEVGGVPIALSRAEKWAKYRQNLSLPNLSRLRSSASVYSGWDDHEFRNDFSIPEFGRALYDAGRQAFLDYAPASFSPRVGLYRRVRWGRDLELFFLDQRSFRDAKVSAGPACDNPFGTFRADLAPTAPQRLRNAFGFAIPPLRNPIPKPCLDALSDRGRTMLGRLQLRRFLRDVARSRATFKVVVNETPIQQFYALPYDRWEGYASERDRVLRSLRRSADNVVFLTTDTHANMVNDARLQTLEAGGPRESGMLEVVTGPVATNTFAREIDTAVGISGAGNTIGRLFFKPGPPAGVGMQCVALDVYSYAQVTVRGRRLTVSLKDLRGSPVRDLGGGRCGPFRVRAR